MTEKYINKLSEGLLRDGGIESVNKMIHYFDSGEFSKIFPHLSDEEVKLIIENKTKIKSISEKISNTLSNGGVRDFDLDSLMDLSDENEEVKNKLRKYKE